MNKGDNDWLDEKIKKYSQEKLAREKLMKESVSSIMIENMESWLVFMKSQAGRNYDKDEMGKLFEEFVNNYNGLDQKQ